MLKGWTIHRGFDLPLWEQVAMSLIVGGLAFLACVL